MAERNIAAEVLKGLHEVREHRAGKRTPPTTRVEVKSLGSKASPGRRMAEIHDEQSNAAHCPVSALRQCGMRRPLTCAAPDSR